MNFTVYKLDAHGREDLHYQGEVIERGENYVCVRAIFRPQTSDLGYMLLKQGDIFTEWFYTDRWYNIFKIEDIDTGNFKGFYCNLTRPAIISENSVKADDLELDVFVTPSGDTLLLDEDEYEALALSDEERQHVENAVLQLHQLVENRQPPFENLTG